MDHSEVRQQLSAYLDGEVDPVRKGEIEDHLSSCEGCRQALKEIRQTVEAVRGMGPAEPPPWLTGWIMARVREEQASRRGWLAWFVSPSFLRPAMSMAVVVLIAGIVWNASRPMRSQPAPAQLPVTAPEPKIPVVTAPRVVVERIPRALPREQEKNSGTGFPSMPSLAPVAKTTSRGITVTLTPSDPKTTCVEIERSLGAGVGRSKDLEKLRNAAESNRCQIAVVPDEKGLSPVVERLRRFGTVRVPAVAPGATPPAEVEVDVVSPPSR